MIKITGLEELSRDLKEAQRALEQLDGELGVVSFDPESPESIEAAISKANNLIDERMGRYSSNPLVQPLVEQSKEYFRQSIIDRAAELRLEKSDSNERDD